MVKLNTEVEAMLSPRELAGLLGISTKTLRRWIESGHLPPPDHRFTRRTLRWRASTVAAVVEGSTRRKK